MTQHPRAFPPILALDPEEAERSKAERARQLNALQVPALRLIGLGLVAVGVFVHNRFVLGTTAWPEALAFAAIAGVYGLVSWLVLDRWYGRTGAVDLGVVFLALDLLVFTLAIYYTGADRSWLFFILIVRVADQTPSSFRRALAFGHAAPASYLAMLLELVWVEHRQVAWSVELTKLVAIYGAGLYIALTARTAERRRRRTAEAVHVARDLIRELADKSRELEAARSEAEEASRAKSHFLASMSHELRTPLNSIVGFSKVLLNRVEGDLTERQAAYLGAVHTSGTHLLRVINGILDLARIEAGKGELQCEELDVHGVVSECLEISAPLVRGKPVKLEKDLSLELPRLYADRTKIKQVLLNLLSNAIKFTAAGRVLVRVQGESTALHVTVADTGIGIRPEALPRLFEPFQRFGTPVQEMPGTGLGLAISRRFVELHGGRMWVESREHQGSAFHFTLPLDGGRAP
jgi:signal transduction histidine kinase